MRYVQKIAVVVALVLVAQSVIGCGGDGDPDPEPDPAPPPPTRSSRIEAAKKLATAQMAGFASAIEMYYLRHRKLPDSLEALAEVDPLLGEPSLTEIPDDPWGNPYEYKPLDGKKYWIRSVGEDGHSETDDDMFWPPLER